MSLCLSAFVTFLITGCAKLEPGLKKGASVGGKGGLEIHAQYAFSSDPKAGCNTYEVYIANHTKETVAFSGAELNGNPLPKVYPKEISKLLTVKMGEGDEIQLTEPGFPEDSPVTWWQYYPCNEVKPGETIEFQANFKALPGGRQQLRLIPSVPSIENVTVPAPRFRQPDKRLTAVTYSLDGKRMFVQYVSRKIAIKKLSINGQNIRKFNLLQSSDGNTPDLVAFDAPFELKDGDVLHVRSEFQDGSRRDALVRVLLGIALDGGFSGGNNEQAIRKEYGLDEHSIVTMLPFDVACGDAKAGQQGMSAPAVAVERLKLYESQIEKKSLIGNPKSRIGNSLLAVSYCAASCPATWNIYSQISDAVYAKPYQLGWGKQPARFIEAEERRALAEAQSAQPRPWLWIPDRFNRSGRYMASGELEVLAWLMLERGGKGIRYHYWNRPVEVIMAEHPWLLAGLGKLNKDIALQKEILSSLVWVNEWNLEKEKIKMYESWSGDQGILILARNLDYRTEAAETKGQEPRFKVAPKQDVNIAVRLPVWFKGKNAKDLLSGKSLPAEKENNVIQVKLDRLETFRLIWME
ncbi:MAG: hypothetical protein PHW60_10425 [Kiritimatiellae bacterium]|nr:hypothetical protein [Kiritimatiellia bacterium]